MAASPSGARSKPAAVTVTEESWMEVPATPSQRAMAVSVLLAGPNSLEDSTLTLPEVSRYVRSSAAAAATNSTPAVVGLVVSVVGVP